MTHTVPKTVMVDLDGTLANNISPLYGAYNEFLGHYGVVGSRAEFQGLIGPPIKEAVAHLKERYNLKPPLEDLVTQYQGYIEEGYRCSYVLHTGAELFLEWCHAQGIALILATAAPRSLALTFLNRYHLAPYFQQVITGDDSPFTKIDPTYYLAALDGDTSDALMIDDSPAVVATAEKAGLATYLFEGDWHELMRRFSVHLVEKKLAPSFCVEVVEREYPPLEAHAQKLIEEIWDEQQLRHPETLFNGNILSRIKSDNQRLIGTFVEYKHYLAQTYNPALKPLLNINPVGITVIVTDGAHVLVGKRSDSVSIHNQLFELVPSGSVDDQFLAQGKIKLEELAMDELREECGLSTDEKQSFRPAYLLQDPSSGLCEICCVLTIEKKVEVKPGLEHTELLWLPLDQAEEFMDENPFVPHSAHILKRLLG